MITTLLFVVALQGGQVVVQGGPPPKPVPRDAPATLPDTPQARHVKAYIDAFNAGDEVKFLKVQEELMAPEVLAKRPADQRAQMYARLRENFSSFTIKRVAAAPAEIRAIIPDNDGNEAIFSFSFENKAPFKITSIAIDVGNVVR